MESFASFWGTLPKVIVPIFVFGCQVAFLIPIKNLLGTFAGCVEARFGTYSKRISSGISSAARRIEQVVELFTDGSYRDASWGLRMAFFKHYIMGLARSQFVVRCVLGSFLVTLVLVIILGNPGSASAYPVYAQVAYENPREPTGRIVCANCHLAERPVEIQVPQSVFPDTVFEAVVRIPYDSGLKQLVSTGKKGSLNVGAILILPEGFKLAPTNRLSEDLKVKTEKLFILPYANNKTNILVLGPLLGSKNKQVVFPVLAPSLVQGNTVPFLNYPLYVGGNRGRGQVYPDGGKSNNVVISSLLSGSVVDIRVSESGGTDITLESSTGERVVQNVSRGLEILVKVGEKVDFEQPLIVDPNVGGFGQSEVSIVFQETKRIQALVFFLLSVSFSQIFFVLKKKQFEKVQEVELNF